MKKYIFFFAAAFTLTMLSSCNDLLDLEPENSISPERYFSTSDQLQAYADGLYQSVLPSHGAWSYGTFGVDKHTDNQADINYSNRYVPGQWKVPNTDGDWYFKKLYDCNYFLAKVMPKYYAGAITGNRDQIRHYIGEIYFLRAYETFKRYLKYGDFPIIDTLLTDNKELLTQRSKRYPRNEVARFIIADLDRADTLMSADIDRRHTRINRNCALLMKSRVGLFEGTFLKYFRGTAYVPAGKDWPGAAEYIDYQYPSGSIDNEIDYFLDVAIKAAAELGDKVQLTDNTGQVQQSASEPANPYMDMFASEDLSSYPEVLLWRQYDYSYKDKGQTHAVGESAQHGNYHVGVTRGLVDCFLMSNGLPIYDQRSGYWGDDYISDVRADRDSRLSCFLKEPGQKNVLIDNGIGVRKQMTEPYPKIVGASGEDTYVTGYTLRKGNPWDAKHLDNNGSFTGSITFRGVEALLNYMEAYYERHGELDSRATGYWKKIRRRSKVDDDVEKTIRATDMSQEAPNDWGAYSAGKVLADKTLYNIRRERRCELMAEGLRWMDLLRWRACDQMIKTPYHIEGFKLWGPMQNWYEGRLVYGADNNKANVSSPEESVYLRPYEKWNTSLVFRGYRFAKAHYLNPIPVQQMILTSPDGDALNSILYQNPYWPSTADQGALE